MSDDLIDSNDELAVIEAAIAELWALKKCFDRHRAETAKPLNFDFLLRREDYREKVLQKLVQSKQVEISGLAKTLLAKKLKGSVHIDDVRAAQNDADKIDENIDSYALEIRMLKKSQQKSILLQQQLEKKNKQLRLFSAVFGVLALVAIAVQLQPLIYGLTMNRLIVLDEDINEDTQWHARNTYVLTRPIFVEGMSVLTIEAGTKIVGEPGAALIVSRDAKVIAKGTEELPIVFTSSKPEGQRYRGDWGGVVLLGNAPVNRKGHIEGIDILDVRGEFGGQDRRSNCGVLEYVRVEFAGFETFVDNELNGLTLGGCGSDTIVRNIQVHKSLDDGIEIFGGTVDLKNIVVSGAGDDAFDWDMGWTGRVQFLIVQMHEDGGDNAFEGDSNSQDNEALPRSNPSFYNISLIGANNQQVAHRAMTIRHGSGGFFGNVLMVGFSKDSIDFRGKGVSDLVANNELSFTNILMYDIASGEYFESEEGNKDDDAGFSEAEYFSRPEIGARFGLDPRFPTAIYNRFNPEFIPLSHSPARESNAVIPEAEFWDEGANYIGATRPGAASSWFKTWTAFPSS